MGETPYSFWKAWADGGDAVLFLEGVGQVILVQMGQGGQLVQRDVLAVVGVDVALDLGALAVVRAGGALLQLQRQGAGADQPDQKHLQKVLADRLVAVQAVVGFGQQHVQQGTQALPLVFAVEDGVGVVRLAEQHLDARDAQHHIFQRGGVEAQLGVLDLRVDDDQVVGADRVELPADVELPLAAQAVEQLGAGVGVGGAVPVAAKAALADVQKAEGLPRGGGVADVKAVGAHCAASSHGPTDKSNINKTKSNISRRRRRCAGPARPYYRESCRFLQGGFSGGMQG